MFFKNTATPNLLAGVQHGKAENGARDYNSLCPVKMKNRVIIAHPFLTN